MVLLILAAVAISSITNDGIIQYAQNAAKDYNQAVKNEQSIIDGYGEILSNYFPVNIAPGLYETDSNYTVLLTSWKDLLENKIIRVENGIMYTNLDLNSGVNNSSNSLKGDLMLPADGSITSLGDFIFSFDNSEMSGRAAFMQCEGLTGIIIPDTVTYISEMAFGYCVNLKNVTIPSSVNLIGNYAFTGCTGLQSVNIESGVTSIGGAAFAYCLELNNVTIPETVCYIGATSFTGCSKLTNIIIPKSVTVIEAGVFLGCTGLNSILVDEENSNYYSSGGCLIEKSTKKLIASCSGLSIIDIPEGVTTIDIYALSNSTNITSINIPTSVITIGENALYQNANLATINYGGTMNEWKNNITFNENWNYKTGSFVVNCVDGVLDKSGNIVTE